MEVTAFKGFLSYTWFEIFINFLLQKYKTCNISDRPYEIAEIAPTSATQGRTYHDDEDCNAVAHSLDRDLSTVAASQTENGEVWLKLEFHKTYFIHKVVIYYRFYNNWYNSNDGCVSSVDNFKKCVDNDNNVNVSVYQGEAVKKSCGTLQLAYGLEQSDQIYTLLCNTEGDTVKLSKSTGNIAVYEVAITGKSKFILKRLSTELSDSYTFSMKFALFHVLNFQCHPWWVFTCSQWHTMTRLEKHRS